MKTKVCNKYDCASGGRKQSVKNFDRQIGNSDGYRGYCRACMKNAAVGVARVERVSNDEWKIDNMLYKLWPNGWVFFHNGFEYVRSSNDQKWLLNAVSNG